MSSSGWIYNYLPISLLLVLRLFPSFHFINDTSVRFFKPKGCPPVVWIFYLKKGINGHINMFDLRGQIMFREWYPEHPFCYWQVLGRPHWHHPSSSGHLPGGTHHLYPGASLGEVGCVTAQS